MVISPAIMRANDDDGCGADVAPNYYYFCGITPITRVLIAAIVPADDVVSSCMAAVAVAIVMPVRSSRSEIHVYVNPHLGTGNVWQTDDERGGKKQNSSWESHGFLRLEDVLTEEAYRTAVRRLSLIDATV